MRFMIEAAVFAVVAFACGGLSTPVAAQARAEASLAERQLLASANRARRAGGLSEFRWDEALAAAARRHAALMAQHAAAEHGFPGEPSLASRATQVGARFVWLAENVAQGPGAEAIHEEFLKSPNHRANLLDSDMDSIGIGVVDRGGQLFAVEDFSKAK